MQSLHEGVDGEGESLGQFDIRPGSIPIMRQDDGPGAIGIKAQRIPIYLCHNKYLY